MNAERRFRAQCRWLRRATLVVFVGLALLHGLGMVGLPLLFPAGAVSEPGDRLIRHAISALPGLGYLWALWAVQQALGQLADGALFQQTVARAMRQMGAGVLTGALLSVFVVINLARWASGGGGSYLYFDLSAIVLGVVGAALIMLARVVDQARALQSELDEIL
ncbi:DUF2975 domain-containing protein [Pseudomarimonas salicorniae]|uniref:DUF2975 domain-containing protein n=1 Tax=Pseudomarimonas salicorniae TaxID=2933270 RepID=A0ABT0GJX5_9GAMM|nr:DUF2975 domain-containing protein [Lysobacter sp. CAU 1642]MCK7594835.1 DUF2975 domain-containing protein [Lysobacter sp. CAU 1642]